MSWEQASLSDRVCKPEDIPFSGILDQIVQRETKALTITKNVLETFFPTVLITEILDYFPKVNKPYSVHDFFLKDAERFQSRQKRFLFYFFQWIKGEDYELTLQDINLNGIVPLNVRLSFENVPNEETGFCVDVMEECMRGNTKRWSSICIFWIEREEKKFNAKLIPPFRLQEIVKYHKIKNIEKKDFLKVFIKKFCKRL